MFKFLEILKEFKEVGVFKMFSNGGISIDKNEIRIPFGWKDKDKIRVFKNDKEQVVLLKKVD